MKYLFLNACKYVYYLLILLINFYIFIKIFQILRKKINIFSINNGAIGHYPINIFLSIKMFGKDKVVFFFKKGIKGSNEYLNNKLKEEFNFNDKYERIYKFIDVLNFLSFKKLKINQMPNVSHMGKNNNFSSLFEKPSKIFEFNLNENNIGNEYLKRINTEENKFVCLLIRNDEYYKSIGITGSNLERMKFRNVDPKNYINSIEYLIEKGFHVIRMGKNHQTNFPFKHEKFIDYAISKDRSDFLDIWLTAKCYFFLSSSTGLGSLPLLFNKPYSHKFVTVCTKGIKGLVKPCIGVPGVKVSLLAIAFFFVKVLKAASPKATS